MKKGAITFSGVLTLIVGLLLLFCSLLIVGNVFSLGFITSLTASGVLQVIYEVSLGLFVSPLQEILTKMAGVEASLLQTIFSIVLTLFSIFLIIWGIVEISYKKKSDDKFLTGKKKCMFPLLLKLFFSLYAIAFTVMSFVMEDTKFLFEKLNVKIGISFIAQIILLVLGLLMLLGFIMPLVNFSSAKKFFANGGQANEPNDVYNAQDPNMAYQNQYYNYTQAQPLDPNTLIQSGQPDPNNPFNIIPGQNGVPQNITQKGLDDLARLERLKASGAIDEQNYQVMKQTICNNNIA